MVNNGDVMKNLDIALLVAMNVSIVMCVQESKDIVAEGLILCNNNNTKCYLRKTIFDKLKALHLDRSLPHHYKCNENTCNDADIVRFTKDYYFVGSLDDVKKMVTRNHDIILQQKPYNLLTIVKK